MRIDFSRELQRDFESELVSGAFEIDTVWTVPSLCERFGATDVDMRQVLVAAYRKGLVEAEAGRFRILGLAERGVGSVHAHTHKRGLKPTSEVRAVEVEPASEEVAGHLAIEAGAPVYRFERTRRIDGSPLANQINYLPFDVCPGLEEEDVSRRSFQGLLEETYHVVLTGAEEHLSIVPATDQDRDVLGLPPGASVLEISRLARSATEQPVVWAVLHIDPNQYRYVAELWPAAARLLASE
jgi:DNA-binding GntR family transcriptional regulator